MIMAKILYVEDDKGNVAMMLERLVRRGFEVVVAENGRQAIAMARSEEPSVILMDLELPEMDGWEATRRLKAAPDTRGIPVIALSAHAMPGIRETAIAAGCDDYDVKPVDLPRLLQKIGSLIEGSRTHA
jgi:CheY-like chemotaxis protein